MCVHDIYIHIIRVNCFIYIFSNLSSSSAYRAWRGNHRNRAASIRSRLHTRPTQLLSSVASGASSPEAGRPSAEELPVPASLRAASSPRPRESRLLGLGSISSPFGMLSNSLVSTSELLFKLIDDSQPQVTSEFSLNKFHLYSYSYMGSVLIERRL